MNDLVNECRERASYLKAMEPEGLTTIERQCMETLFKAADLLEQRAAGHSENRKTPGKRDAASLGE
jgi:hypothetical protein